MGGSAIRRRQLARELRELRESSGYSLEVAAVKLEWSTSKLSRIETGQQTVDIHSVRGMLDLYDLGGDRATHIQELCRAARQRGWWKAYGLDDLGYVALEAEASMVLEYALAFIPGLLQTVEYARAVFGTGTLPRSNQKLDNELAARMIRQRRITSDDPLQLVTVLDESVLLRAIGGTRVMRGQLEHLLQVAEVPSITMHVLPFNSMHGLEGGFTILRFGELAEPDVAYIEHLVGSLQVNGEDEVRRATLAFDRLRSAALNPVDSIGLVREVLDRT